MSYRKADLIKRRPNLISTKAHTSKSRWKWIGESLVKLSNNRFPLSLCRSRGRNAFDELESIRELRKIQKKIEYGSKYFYHFCSQRFWFTVMRFVSLCCCHSASKAMDAELRACDQWNTGNCSQNNRMNWIRRKCNLYGTNLFRCVANNEKESGRES